MHYYLAPIFQKQRDRENSTWALSLSLLSELSVRSLSLSPLSPLSRGRRHQKDTAAHTYGYNNTVNYEVSFKHTK
jgi:hypothetical protein